MTGEPDEALRRAIEQRRPVTQADVDRLTDHVAAARGTRLPFSLSLLARLKRLGVLGVYSDDERAWLAVTVSPTNTGRARFEISAGEAALVASLTDDPDAADDPGGPLPSVLRDCAGDDLLTSHLRAIVSDRDAVEDQLVQADALAGRMACVAKDFEETLRHVAACVGCEQCAGLASEALSAKESARQLLDHIHAASRLRFVLEAVTDLMRCQDDVARAWLTKTTAADAGQRLLDAQRRLRTLVDRRPTEARSDG